MENKFLKALKFGPYAYLISFSLIALSVTILSQLLQYSGDGFGDIVGIFGNILADRYIRHITYFSFYQAGLSTLLAIFIAIPVAIFLSRRNFVGKAIFIRISMLTFILPTMVSVFAIISVHGRTGIVNDLLSGLGVDPISYLYGISGILLAHIFINMPFCSTIFLSELNQLPKEYWRLSKQLGFSEWYNFRHIEWPAIKAAIPNLASLIFILHFTSFATVLTLGGGPKATTLEVAIFHALKSFDLSLGASLAILQLTFCLILSLILQKYRQENTSFLGATYQFERPKVKSWQANLFDILVIFIIFSTTILPITTILFNALVQTDFSILLKPILLTAAWNSITLALFASSFAILLTMILLLSKRSIKDQNIDHFSTQIFSIVGNLILIIPSLVFGMGLFLLLKDHINIFDHALKIIFLVNGLMALPYMIKILDDPIENLAKQHRHLCLNLGLSGWQRFKLIDWPTLRKPIAQAWALGATISFGDFGVIALIGNDDTITLPMLLYQSIGAYRAGDGAIIALLLALGAFSIYMLIQKVVGGKHVKA